MVPPLTLLNVLGSYQIGPLSATLMKMPTCLLLTWASLSHASGY
jgi:hypothetical protein